MLCSQKIQLKQDPPVAALAHHPIIQKEMNELLAKDAIKPLIGVLLLLQCIFVPKCTRGLRPILNLKWFNCYIHIPTFMLPAIKQTWWVIQEGDYSFLLISRMLIYMFLLSITVNFYILFGNLNLMSGSFRHLGWQQSLAVWLHVLNSYLLNPYCSFADAKIFTLLCIWIILWFWLTQSVLARGHECFCALYYFILVYKFIFHIWT